jgi:hypothetical protein
MTEFTRLSILFAVDLKHASFHPSADNKPVQNDVAHAMP